MPTNLHSSETMVAEFSILNLLASIGEAEPFTVTEVPGGFNNRVFRLDTGETRYLLKEYFRNGKDSRDRLGTEYGFCKFASTLGVDGVAKPYACDTNEGIGLYEFIEGVDCCSEDVTLQRVLEAANFYKRLNELRGYPAAKCLAKASEACFSIKEHTECVSKRVMRLASIPTDDTLNRRALHFVKESLVKRLREIKVAYKKNKFFERLGTEEYSLSPSDFGFHNMLIDSENDLRFVDFEYAGWDDPAKMITDFFCQPRISVPFEWMDDFAGEAIGGQPWADTAMRRVKILYPLYRVKWCCIIMNEFLPEGNRRRDFSANYEVSKTLKLAKLEAAENYFTKTPEL
tara:strand:- start:1059 stop:2090 length:1032 start_codon:yes stop_codon:yes gene_type:complete